MIQLTRAGKYTLYVNSPVMPAAGTMGFGNIYHKLLNIDKLGAFVTNPITYEPWSPTTSARVIELEAGMLLHTGLPNMGLSKTVKEYRANWRTMPIPVILHLVGTRAAHVQRAMERLDAVESISAVELGLDDDVHPRDADDLIRAAKQASAKPLLVRLPAMNAALFAEQSVDAGADALVIAAPPRGTARDPYSGKLVSGRIYGPLVKPMLLRLVGKLAREITDVPIIGAGGIHSPQDARDYLEAGAVAVQVDSATWLKPRLMERIARDLGSGLVTRASDAYPDEWHPDMGDTEFRELFGGDEDQSDATTPH